MAQITWILADGTRLSDEVSKGTNLMEAAQFLGDGGVKGIDGECGGCLSCATCHVVVDEVWGAQASATCPMGEVENSMLEITPAPRQSNSRLSCQLIASDALDGLVLHVPNA